jgi:acyl-CoA thioester hydrolase
MSKPVAARRADFRYFTSITTRWMDNDVYAHLNNVVYYSFFDTVVNKYLVEAGVLDFVHGEVVGYVVDTRCSYFSQIAFPDTVHAGLRVAHVGNSSVRYEIGLFRNDEEAAAAQGEFVHVYVLRSSGRPTTLPPAFRSALAALHT